MGGSKNARLQWKNKFSIVYQRIKIQKLGSPKNEKVKKTWLTK
jgi:hypothetical protein